MANKTLLIIAVIVIIVAIFLISKPAEIDEETLGEGGKNVGDTAFDLSFTTFDGKEDKFSNYRGKVVIINAWTVWCPFCLNEMPLMQKISNDNEDVVVLFIHRTSTESKSTAQPYLDDFASEGIPITDPIFEDPRDKFYTTFFGFGMTVSIILDKDGVIRDRKVGEYTESELEDEVQRILEG